MARANSGMGTEQRGQQGGKNAAVSDDGRLREVDLAQDKMGKNSLQGDDQGSVRNQRRAQADAKPEPDEDVIESFEKMDKDVRAATDLGKGNRGG